MFTSVVIAQSGGVAAACQLSLSVFTHAANPTRDNITEEQNLYHLLHGKHLWSAEAAAKL